MIDHRPLIEATNLGRRHPNGTEWLLREVSIEVCAGQRIALIGPSGAGKTLLLRALAMLDPADSGEIRWQGVTVAGSAIPSYRSRTIYLHQRPEPIEGTVERFFRQPFELKIHHDNAFDRDRVVGYLDALGRGESFLKKPGRDLSGGEGQIAMLIRALQLDPQVLLLDEPTAALDAHAATEVEELLTQWVKTNGQRAFVWVSHDMERSGRTADNLWRMDHGQGIRCSQ